MAELGPTGALKHLLDPPALCLSPPAPGDPEHQHQNYVPEVTAVVLPNSCIQ